jgi:hypothetical protein
MATKTGKKNARGGIAKVGLNTKDESGNFVMSAEPKTVASFTNTAGEKRIVTEDPRTKIRSTTNAPTSTKDIAGTPIISSEMGKGLVTQATKTLDNLSPITTTGETQDNKITNTLVDEGKLPESKRETTQQQSPTANDFETYVNESTGQEWTLRGEALTDEARKKAIASGGVLASSEVSGVKTTPEIAKLKREYDMATREADGFMSRLESMLISDKELRGEVRQIGTKYEARKNEMREINERRQVAMETLGIRTGARYTGGSGGIMGGLLSEEERQGLMRIENIENDKQDAIMQAKKAARDQNFQLYTQLANKAEKIQERKATELQALKKAQAEQDKKIAEENKKSLVGAVVSDLINRGITSNNEIYSKLTDPSIAGIIGNVAPEDFKKLMDALLPSGTGIIGEYEYYKREAQRMGQTPLSFDDYQTRDANRKRSVTNNIIGGSDLNTKEQVIFNSLVDKASKSPLIMANDRATILRDTVKALETDPLNSSLQVTFIYSMIQALDTYQSAVREGEIGLLSGTQGVKEQIINLPDKITQGTPLSKETIKKYMDTATMLTGSINGAAEKKWRDYQAQANINGDKVGGAFQEYRNVISADNTAQTAIQDEAQAETTITNWVAQSPENKQRLLDLQQILPDATLSEIVEELGL